MASALNQPEKVTTATRRSGMRAISTDGSVGRGAVSAVYVSGRTKATVQRSPSGPP